MVEIKNVAVVGAAGALGTPMVKALIDSGKFNVTVVQRASSKSTHPAAVKVVTADITSVESVTAAFKGIDAVISTVGTEGLEGQHVLIDAAVASGVKRFLPSDFGSDLANPKVAAFPIFGYKIATHKKLQEAVAVHPEFTYTSVCNGPFLDYCINMGLLLDVSESKPKLFDGGNTVFSTTTLATVAQATVGVLTHFEETKNRFVYVRDMDISQNRILDIAKKLAPERKWEPVVVSTADIEKSSNESLAKGEVTMQVMIGYLLRGIFAEGYGSKMDKDDNELLGVAGNKSDADIEALLKPLLASK